MSQTVRTVPGTRPHPHDIVFDLSPKHRASDGLVLAMNAFEISALAEKAALPTEQTPVGCAHLYSADHPLAAEFEEQTAVLLREYKGEGKYLSPHHLDEPGP